MFVKRGMTEQKKSSFCSLLPPFLRKYPLTNYQPFQEIVLPSDEEAAESQAAQADY